MKQLFIIILFFISFSSYSQQKTISFSEDYVIQNKHNVKNIQDWEDLSGKNCLFIVSVNYSALKAAELLASQKSTYNPDSTSVMQRWFSPQAFLADL